MIEAHAMRCDRPEEAGTSSELLVSFTMKDVANLPVFMKAMHDRTQMSFEVNVYDSPSFDRLILDLSSGDVKVANLHMHAGDSEAHGSFEMTLKFVNFTLTRFVLDHSGDNASKQMFTYAPAAT